MEKIRKVKPVDFEFDMIFVNLMRYEPLEAAEKLLNAFRFAREEDMKLLEDIELNIPDVNDTSTRLLFSAINSLKCFASESVRQIDDSKFQVRIGGMVSKQMQKDTVQAVKDLFGTLSTEQMDKLLKTIDDVRESMKGK